MLRQLFEGLGPVAREVEAELSLSNPTSELEREQLFEVGLVIDDEDDRRGAFGGECQGHGERLVIVAIAPVTGLAPSPNSRIEIETGTESPEAERRIAGKLVSS